MYLRSKRSGRFPAVERCASRIPFHALQQMMKTRDDARQRITVRAVGVVSLEEILSEVQQQHDDGTWNYAVLYDLRQVVPGPVASEVRELANKVAAISPSSRGPVAVVVTDVVLYGRACTYAALIRPLGRRFQVFRDLADADSWLTAQTGAP